MHLKKHLSKNIIIFVRFVLVLVVLAQSVVAWVTQGDRLCAVINQIVGSYMGLFLGEAGHAVLDTMNSQYLHVSQSLSTG